jgi:hypothetical protein
MNVIKTKLGTAYYDEDKDYYVLERTFESLPSLLNKEKEIRNKFKESNFTIKKLAWTLVDNPCYKAAQFFNDCSVKPTVFGIKIHLNYVSAESE